MMVRYPYGKKFTTVNEAEPELVRKVNYANRGMSLESAINDTNIYYLEHDIAVVHKKPIPIQIVKVDYPHRSAAVIKEAYYQQASTTDYNGVYRGRYLDFEAKETNQKSFPLKNFHDHQIVHMRRIVHQNAISFVLIHFIAYDELYFLSANNLFSFWDRMLEGGRKSITRDEIRENGKQIQFGFMPTIDYIKIVDELIAEQGK